MDGGIYSQLSELGFRRSGEHVYRPRCRSCQACIPIRIPVSVFKPSKSQKRCLKRNSDLKVSLVDNIDGDEYFDLYEKYINTRHRDGDMYPPSKEQYVDFLTKEWGITRYLAFRDKEDKLVSVAVADLLDNGVSAIYTFFDPDAHKRSLGVYNILFQIQWAKELKVNYVYLGYWIRQCQKMSYKVDYHPFQLLVNDSWITVSDYSPPQTP